MKNCNNMTNVGGGNKFLLVYSIASLLYGDSVSAMEMEVEYPEQSFKEEIIYKNNNNAQQNTGRKSQKSNQISWRKNKVFTRSRSDNKYTEFQEAEYYGERLNLKSSHSKLLQYKAFPNLKKLAIVDYDLRCINEASPKFPKLEKIEVIGEINKENFASLLTLLSKAPNLKILNLEYVTMTTDNLKDFMNYMEGVRDYRFKELKLIGFVEKNEKKINALTELYLEKLAISDYDLRCINEASPKFPKLEEIEVIGEINKENFASLLTLLSKAPNLKILNLEYVTMTTDNLMDFMNYTEDVRDYRFKELKLIGFVGKNEKKINALTELFIYVKKIESLDLSGIGLSVLPASVETMKDLRILNICGNKLLTNLPEEIGELRNLRILNLSGTGLTKLPEEIGNLASLEELYLSSKMGDLPNSVTNLRNLKIFDAAGCDNAKFWTIKLQTLKSINKNLEIILE